MMRVDAKVESLLLLDLLADSSIRLKVVDRYQAWSIVPVSRKRLVPSVVIWIGRERRHVASPSWPRRPVTGWMVKAVT